MQLLIAGALAPLVVVFLVASFRQPLKVALPVYAALLPFGSGLTTGLPSAFGSVSSLAGVVLTLALTGQLMTSRRGSSTLPSSLPVWLMFLAVAGASTFWSIAPRVTVNSFIVLTGLTALFALLALSNIDRPTLDRTENAIIIGAVIAVGYGLLQLFFLGGLPSSPEGAPRFGNGLLGPNNQAAALLLPLAIALARTAARTRPWSRTGHAVVAAMMLAGILLTGSRGGLLTAAVTVALVVVLATRGRAPLIGGCVVAAALLAVVLLVNPGGIGARQTGHEGSSGRSEVWRVGVHACQTVCVAGSGWGTFGLVYERERASVPDARVLRRGSTFEPHNIWLLAAVEAGFLGLLLMTAGLSLTLTDALRLPRAVRGPPLAALVGTVMAGFFLSNLEFKFFWMVLTYVALTANATGTGSRAPVASDSPERLPQIAEVSAMPERRG